MELKYNNTAVVVYPSERSNRTFMELKFPNGLRKTIA